MSKEDRSSLGLELIELALALESVRLVTDLERARALASRADARVAPRAVSATVGLVVDRLRALGATLSDGAAKASRPSPASSSGAGPRAARRRRRA